jgi:peptidoglycan/LPS O-acetylase OafA/YrhL
LDSLRALAAIYVVIHHAVLHYYPSINDLSTYALTPCQAILFQFLKHGYYAVDLFIILSGFSLMLSAIRNDYTLKGGAFKFIKRRIYRILPPYYSALIISALLIWFFIGNKTGTQWDVAVPLMQIDMIRHIFLIHDFYYSSFPKINDVMWSVAAEFRIYLFFPLILFLWKKYNAVATILASVIIALVSSITLIYLNKWNIDINFTGPGVSPYIILFTMGMIAAELSYSNHHKTLRIKNLYQKLSYTTKILAPFIVVALFALAKIALKNGPSRENVFIIKDIMDILIGILFAFILFNLSLIQSSNPQSGVLKLLLWKPLAWIGTFSYSLYLIHSPILQLISTYLLSRVNSSISTKSYLLIVIGTSLAIIISYFFHLLFERPFFKSHAKPKIVKVAPI